MKTSIVRKRRPTQVGMSPEVADKQKLAETPDTTLRLAPGFSHGLSRWSVRNESGPSLNTRVVGVSIAPDVYRALVESIIHRCCAGRTDESFPEYTLSRYKCLRTFEIHSDFHR